MSNTSTTHLLENNPQQNLIEVLSMAEKEWQGMPEFVQERQREFAKIIVRFRCQEDLDDFCKLIGQKLNRKSQCTWHPELKPEKCTVRKYVNES